MGSSSFSSRWWLFNKKKCLLHPAPISLSGDWPVIIARALPAWMEMHIELCQHLHQSSPKDGATWPKPHGWSAGHEAGLVLPVLLRRSLRLQEQVSLGEEQHNRTVKAKPCMQLACSPDGGIRLHSSAVECSDNQHNASTTGPFCVLAVPNYQLIPH